tara:strand:- start:35 stop:367 length:333 start_codon:yes stop_codon:yes gene_type:complete
VKHADVVWNGKERVWEASSPIDGTQVVALSREGLVDRLKVLEHQKIVADTVSLIDRLQLDVQQYQEKLGIALDALTWIGKNTKERGTGMAVEEAVTKLVGKSDYSQSKLK